MAHDATAEELPDASLLGEPPPLEEVLDDLAMRFVVNCPAEEQESFERLLFQVEAAFWFYEDQYREIWPHAFPTLTLLTFSQQMFACCPLLKAFEHRAKEIYDAFTTYKLQIPTCGAMLLNSNSTKLLLVKGWKGHTWGFPKGKIDKDEDKESCAAREVLEEVGYDISGSIEPTKYIEMQWRQQTIRLYVVPGVPDDFPFATRTKKEISEITWHKIREIPTDKDDTKEKDKSNKFWMVGPFVVKLRRFLAHEQQHAKKAKGGKQQQQQVAPPPATDRPASTKSSRGADFKGVETRGETKAPKAAAPQSVAVPLGVSKGKATRSKGVVSTSAAAPSTALPANVQVLQRARSGGREGELENSAGRESRGHPWLDFAFERQPIFDALNGRTVRAA